MTDALPPRGEFLAPRQQEAELDDAVFRVAAAIPLRPFRQDIYKVRGDERYGFRSQGRKFSSHAVALNGSTR